MVSNMERAYNDCFEIKNLKTLAMYVLVVKNILIKLNTFKSNNIDIIDEIDKLPQATYDFQELLMSIYNVLPIKVEMVNISYDNPRLVNSSDNILNIDMLKPLHLLLKSTVDTFKPLFFFNYFIRNAFFHRLHLVRSPGQTGDENGISTFRFEVNIEELYSAQKYFRNLIKEMKTRGLSNYSLFNSKVLFQSVENEGENVVNEIKDYYQTMNVTLNEVDSLVMDIRNSFMEFIELLESKMLETDKFDEQFGYSIEKGISVLRHWKKYLDLNGGV